MDMGEEKIIMNKAENAAQMGQDPLLLRRLLHEHASGVRAAIAANCINAIVLFAVFWGNYPAIDFIAAELFLALLLIWRVTINKNILAQRKDNEALFKLQRQVELNAAALGLWWGLSAMILMVNASPSQQVLCAIIGSGMMAGGAMTFRTVKRAAQLFIIASGGGYAIALVIQQNVAAYAGAALIAAYCMVLFSGIRINGANIRARHKRENDLRPPRTMANSG